MTTDDNRESLADAAAAWVPPWDRPKPPAPEPQSESPLEPEPVVVVPAAGEPEFADPAPVVEYPTSPAAEGTDESAGRPAETLGEETAADGEPEKLDGDPAAMIDGEPAGLHQGEPAGTLDGEPAGTLDGEPVHASVLEPPSAPAVPSQKGPHRAAGPEAADGTAPKAEAAPRRRRAKPVPKEPEPDPVSLIDDAELRGALEAILLVVDEPVPEVMLSQVLEQPTERVTQMLYLLSGEYTDRGHGFDLRRVAGGWRLYTRPEYAAYVERFVLDGQTARLTQAALETLAVVAYKQPCSRSQVSAIRGVNCDGVMRTLVARGLVEECGADTSGAYLYKTTTLFLEKLGIDSVAQLPPLAPFLPDNVEEIVIDA